MKLSFSDAAALVAIGTTACLETQAAAPNNGDVLAIVGGVFAFDEFDVPTDIVSGSYYAVDTNDNSQIESTEKIQLAQGTTGLVIGATSLPGEVTAPDTFFGATGYWLFTVAPTGSTETGLDMSGWNWPWNGIASIPLGGGAWQPGNCAALGCDGYTFTDGIGRLQWDGVYGHGYTLDFTSTVPDGDPSSLGGVQFYTHLEGVVAVPEPAPMVLFAAALPFLFGLARKRKSLAATTPV